jgi:arsenate reductase (thioredoxin)
MKAEKEDPHMKILILCTGNSCRSQMAEGFLKSLSDRIEVFSAGTSPTSHVHPFSVAVMQEIGIDINRAWPKDVEPFLNDSFDYVITVCDNAKETCPVFAGKVRHRLHIGFDDPAHTKGTKEQVMREFRRVRDDIRERFHEFYTSTILPQLTQ